MEGIRGGYAGARKEVGVLGVFVAKGMVNLSRKSIAMPWAMFSFRHTFAPKSRRVMSGVSPA